jgi:CBS domain-containing protein
MTSDVVSVRPEMPIWEVAQLLLNKTISAAPVIDDGGAPIGMVSEGDLIGRNEGERQARRDWWLALLAESTRLEGLPASLRARERKVREVMSWPVVCVAEDTEVREIAQLLAAHLIKRVPVVNDDRIIGIVSRADLLRVIVQARAASAVVARPGFLASAIAGLDSYFENLRYREKARSTGSPPELDETRISATEFRNLVTNFQQDALYRRHEAQRASVERRQRAVADLITYHISDERWRSLWHQGRRAAEQGEEEFMVLRFPNQLCSDGGRAIGMMEPDWPATLRGQAAEIYLRWLRELKPRGFRVAARVLEFPDGMPGDIGLFLIW